MNDLSRRLEKCFAAASLEIVPEETSQASAKSVAQWDSMALVVFISLVEEEFNIQIPPEDLDRFVSYEKIVAYMQEKLGVK